MYKRKTKLSNGSLVGRPACSSSANIRNYVANATEDNARVSQKSVSQSSSTNKENVNVGSVTLNKTIFAPSQLYTVPGVESIDFNNLGELFSLCGLDLEAIPSNVLNLDQAVFVRKLTSALFSHRGKSMENTTKFMSSLKNYFSENDKFFKSLSPTLTAAECDVARGSTQDSVVRLLLQIDEIQTEFANYLLDRLTELGLQNDDNDDFSTEPPVVTAITWVKLILQSFRYLNCIVDSKNLCERLFDIIFSFPDKQIQQEVVIYLPDIIGDKEHQFAANELSKLLKADLELMPAVLDTLRNLSVQSEIRKEVRRNLIDTLRSSPIEFLPNIIKFLMSTCDADSYEEVLNGLRKELLADNSVSLKNTMNEENNIDVDGVKVLIFSNLRNGLLANKQLADSWLKNISHLNREIKCKPLDLFIVLMLHDICTESTKKRNIETIVRGRIKSDLFSVALIDKIFEHHTPVIIEYFNPLMSILSKLLKSVDSCVTKFVTTFYVACLKNTGQQWCENVITGLLGYVGAGDANDAQTALSILSAISTKYPEKIRPTAPMLSVLLDTLTALPLKDVLQLMDMLCFIAFSDTENESCVEPLKTKITALIEKQFSLTKIKPLRIGIIAAVMTIKHLAMVTGEETDTYPDKASEDFDDSCLSDRAKRAVPFLKLLIDGTKTVPEAQGFAFDQLSLMLKKFKNMDKTLQVHTSITMKEKLKNHFLILNDEVKSMDFIECALKFGLTEDEEYVVLNVTPVVVEELNSQVKLRMSILVLPSLLRLVRELEYEDLRAVEGLLECPIMVPAPKVFEEFGLQSPDVQCVAMDSLFYLTNWFRELINCFARMTKQPSGKKVVIRLRTLIWLQQLIAKYLPQMLKSDYCPPRCHFHKSVKAPTVGSDKKKRKSTSKKKNSAKTSDIRKHLVRGDSTIAGTTTISTQCSVHDESDDDTKEDKESTANMKNYKQFFRDLDWDIWVMLSLPLTIIPEPEKDWEMKPEFGPSELVFILEDLVEKVQFVLISSTKKTPFKHSQNEDLGLTSSSLYVEVPELCVKNLVRLTPRLCTHLEALAEYCETLLTKNDNIIDATGMFLPETIEVKTAISLTLKSFSTLFSWPGFSNDQNRDVFVTALSKINSRIESEAKSTSVLSLIKGCVNYFAQFQEAVLQFESALNLVALIEVFNEHADRCPDVNKVLMKMCWSFLSHQWYDSNGGVEKGPAFNKGIEYLLMTYFTNANHKIKAVQTMFEWLQEEVTHLNNKDSSLKTLPNINKANFSILLRVILKTITTATKLTIEESNRPTVRLELWIKVMRTMESIVAIVKIQSVRTNLVCFVKGSFPILRLFLNNGLSVCSTLFRTETAQVTQLLKTLQVTTRYLQKIFDNTRLTADSALVANLPSVRSLLESILLKIKDIVVQNKCNEAFFVGSMRNKDIQGQDILSQMTEDGDSERMEVDDTPNNGEDDRSIEIEDDPSNEDDEANNEPNESAEILQGDEDDDEDEDDDDDEDRRRKVPRSRH